MAPHVYKKTFTRDFTLTMLEVWYKSEALNAKKWNGKIQKHQPYIVFWRNDGTVSSYYDSHGIEWLKNELKNHIGQQDHFLKELEKNVLDYFCKLKLVYESSSPLTKEELLSFINNFEEGCNWFEAMWWICHMYEDGEIKEMDVQSIIDLRNKTDIITSETDIVIRKSLSHLFPDMKEHIHLLTLDEIKTERFPPLEELKKRDENLFYTDSQLLTDISREEIERRYTLHFDDLVPTYKKYFTRNFILATVETWCKAESTDPRQWTAKQQPCKPFIVFERNNEFVSVFYDPEGIEWIKHEISSLLKENSSFIQHIINTFLGYITELKPHLDNTPLLSAPELKEFTSKARKAWAWFEAMWWLIEDLDKKKDVTHLPSLLELRKYSQKLAYSTDAIIRKSIANNLQNKEYAEVILLEEFFSGKMPSESVLKSRLKHYLYTDNTLFEETSPQKLEQKYTFAFEKDNFQSDIVKGSMAYPGKVQGKIRRVMGHKDIVLMQRGEILISPMTMPDFVPAMEKAAAIVTDEGGILCHAAIISRELNIPCIVGTNIATKVFKDGDLVEVDANNGIVRKLNIPESKGTVKEPPITRISKILSK